MSKDEQKKMQGAPGMYMKEVDGKEIYYYINDNGAIVEIVDVRPNTFVDDYYPETGCTVDIDINVYNDDFTEKVSFTLKNVDTKEHCRDWFDDFLEEELEYILDCEDKEGNYVGPEKDKDFYLAAKECQENGLDVFDEYNWKSFRTEKDYEDYCWDLITNTDYTHDQMAELDAIKKEIPKVENPKDLFMAVDVEGTFQIYDAVVPVDDEMMLYGNTLFDGHYFIKGIRKGTEKEMMKDTVDVLCKWAVEKGYGGHTHVYIDTDNFEYWEKEYIKSSLQDPIVEIKREY